MTDGSNPANPYARTRIEWDEPPDLPPLTVHEERARTILTTNDSPDVPFDWSINPYRGCRHACAYCYARRTHEYLDLGAGADFERHIFAKINAPELLAVELARPGWRCERIAFSGVTDCYQALEARYELTRRCLEVCVQRGNPAGVVTKSPLVLRDVDLLRALQERAAVSVCFSIAFVDDARSRKIEPGAPSPSRRFDAVAELRRAGIPVSIVLAPVIPALNDREIPALLKRAGECGAESVSYTPLRLPGNVAPVFLERLRQVLPEAAPRVEARIRAMHGGRLNDPRLGHRMEASGEYWASVQRLFETWATRLGLAGGQSWRRQPQPATPQRPRQMSLF